MAGVVFQLNEGSAQKHRMVLRNIQNLLAEMPDLFVELVVHGEGLGIVLTSESTVAESLAVLSEKGVSVAVCRNSLKGKSLSEADLLPGMTVVNAGIARVVERQQEGFSYIKA
ncbi:MAG: DsrE family protein [Firmicutes bacterium]|nr:DsrE family protein [Bacillota bacterium]